MANKPYKTPKSEPMTLNEPAVAYSIAPAEASSSDRWDPNVPFHGTQEEWWEHFNRIEQGKFTTWEEHQKKFYTWKKKYLASRMK